MSPTASLGVLFLLCIASVHSFVGEGDGTHGGGGRFDGSHDVQAVFSQAGVTGNVHFSQERPGRPVSIHINLECLDQFSNNSLFQWSIHEFPIRSSLLRNYPCSNEQVGGVINAGRNCTDSQCSVGDLTSVVGNIRSDRQTQNFETDAITLYGDESIVGRSLVIDRDGGPEGGFICANIEQLGSNLETLRAAFNNGVIQGDIIIQYVGGRDDATIEVDLYRIDGGGTDSVDHVWTLNYGAAGTGNSCDDVDVVVGSSNFQTQLYDCGPDKQRECPIGGLSLKCGTLDFVDSRARSFCSDNGLGSIPRTVLFDENNPQDRFSIVIGEASGGPGILGCAALELISPLHAKTELRTSTIRGLFDFWQNGPDDRTNIRADLTGLDDEDYSLRIFRDPAPPMGMACGDLGGVFQRNGGVITSAVNPNCPLTRDSCITGNLDSIFPLERGQRSFRMTVSTSTLPLFGPYTIIGRSLGLVLESTNEIIACSTIMLEQGAPQGELASILGYQDFNNPPLPAFV